MIERQLKIFLMRHGLDTGDEMSKFIDGRLTIEGEVQSRRLAEFLKDANITDFYTSPLLRARNTAEIIAQQINCTILEDKRLRDRNLGQAEGMTYSEVQKKFGQLLRRNRFDIDWKFPDGESNGDVYARAREFANSIISRRFGKMERIAIVSHPLVLNYLLYAFLNIGFKEGIIFAFDPGSLAILDYQGTYFQLQQFGQIGALSNS
jgi:probable phosphoglycerate mutase